MAGPKLKLPETCHLATVRRRADQLSERESGKDAWAGRTSRPRGCPACPSQPSPERRGFFDGLLAREGVGARPA